MKASATAPGGNGSTRPDYAAWRDRCAALPSNRSLIAGSARLPPPHQLPLPDFEPLADLIADLTAVLREDLAEPGRWVGEAPDGQTLDPTRSWFAPVAVTRIPFRPFAERLVLPPHAVVIVQADLHGDLHSLLTLMDRLQADGILDGFRLRPAAHHLVFTGDFSDRGAYGAEVTYTVLRLKLANPDQVHLLRGNHEDLEMNAKYGFRRELETKFGKRDFSALYRLYDFLPVVLYAGTATDVVQFTHGGMEPGYSPRDLLAAPGPHRRQFLGPLRRRHFEDSHPGWHGLSSDPVAESVMADFDPISPNKPKPLGFVWSDFTLFRSDPPLVPGRGVVLGEQAVRALFDAQSPPGIRLRSVFRGHQHDDDPNPLMRRLVASDGLFRHWQEADATLADAPPAILARHLETTVDRPLPDRSVWTFNTAPDSIYGVRCGFDFLTTGVLSLDADFSAWNLRVLRLPCPAAPPPAE